MLRVEAEVAEVLGKPAALFLPTGTMAQQATLRVHAERTGRSTFVAHPYCHLDWREGRGYQRLHGLSFRQAGELRRPLTAAALEAVKEERRRRCWSSFPSTIWAVIFPAWDDLEAQVGCARDAGAAAHLDRARIWEAAAGYGCPPGEVTALFDTVYVSFYKGLGSIGGCCVAGPADIVAEVREWRTRHGGTVFGLSPSRGELSGVAAAGGFPQDGRLPPTGFSRSPRCCVASGCRRRTGSTADLASPGPSESGRRRPPRRLLPSGRERKIWTFVRWAPGDTPALQRVELPVGDSTMTFTPDEIGQSSSATC